MKFNVKVDAEKVVFDHNNTIHMMASLTAPDVSKETKRNPLCICAVIDRSGSMGGTKLDQVKSSLWKMIDHMTEDDSLSFVFFDDRIETIQFRKMTSSNKEIMKQEVAKVYARGSTDIGSAMNAARQMFLEYEGGALAIERLMVLTDGQANIGASNMAGFEPIVAGLRKGVTVSTFGYGEGFNEELLTAISKQGKGNSYFIENPDSVSKVFAVELGGLLTCFAQDLVLSIKAHKGGGISNVLNDLDVTTKQDDDGELVTDISIGDIYAGERRDILVKFSLDKRPQALPRPVTIADICLSYRTMDDVAIKKENTKIKVELVKTTAEATTERDKEVSEQVAILGAAHVIMEAKKMADNGDVAGSKQHITSYCTVLRGMQSDTASACADNLDIVNSSLDASYCARGSMSKGMSSYASAMSSRSLSAVGNSSSGFVSAKMNMTMASMVDSFASPDTNGIVTTTTTTSKPDDSDDQANGPLKTTGYVKNRTSKV